MTSSTSSSEAPAAADWRGFLGLFGVALVAGLVRLIGAFVRLPQDDLVRFQQPRQLRRHVLAALRRAGGRHRRVALKRAAWPP